MSSTTGLRGARILLVNDEKEIIEFMAEALENQGYRIRCAYDGAECMAAISQEIPDLLVLNGLMTKMNGDKVLQEMAEDQKWRRIPVLMVSAWFMGGVPSPMYHECNRIAGPMSLHWVPMPFMMEEFLTAVQKALMSGRNARGACL